MNLRLKYIIIIILSIFINSCSFNKFKIKKSKTPDNISSFDKDYVLEILDNNDRVIIRDEWGVPHLFGKTDRDAAFALAYAQAEDDFFTIQEALLKARGSYASVYGRGENDINAIFDYVVGLLKVWENVEERYYTDLSAETIDICEGYAEGINLYIENNINTIDQHIYPVSGKDIIAGTVHKVPFFFQLPIFLYDLYTKEPSQIPSSYNIGNQMEMLDKSQPKGSNVFAVSPTLTDDNSTFLAINSHQPFDGELAWYEAHIHSNEGWNMVGGLFPGSPVVLVGHNENLGWGHTVNKPDILDIYELDINPHNENQYLFDGKWLDFETFDVSIKVKTIGKIKVKIKRPAFWSVHGPVIKGEKATYAIRYSNMNDIKMIEQWYKMNKSNNFSEWKDAIKMISVPMFNSGYADKEGNIFYVYSAQFPNRDEKYDWTKVLPGNTSETLWDTYAPFEQLPQVYNPSSGFIQNCNNTPYQTTLGEENPEIDNFPTTFGIETDMTNRGLRAFETLGKDDKITYQEFKNYKFDLKYSKNSYMSKFVDRAIKLLKESNFTNFNQSVINDAVEIFNNWDLSTDKENKNAALPILSYSKYIDVDPDNLSDQIIIKRISSSLNNLITNFNSLNVEWSEVNRLIRGNKNLPLEGGPDILRAIYGSINDVGQVRATAGDCYMLLVRWDENKNLYSESIHQYGSSTSNKNSLHFDDQADLFAKHLFKNISIEKETIAEQAKSILILDKIVN